MNGWQLPEKFCLNYRSLEKINKAIRAKNTLAGYLKYDAAEDLKNCHECDKYYALMPFKICFEPIAQAVAEVEKEIP